MRKSILILIICVAIAGCASTKSASNEMETQAKRWINFVNYSATNYPPLPQEQLIDLFFQGSPTKSYDVIGEINGSIEHDENIRPMLEARARQVGGNGVIDIQTSGESVSGPTVLLGHIAVPTSHRATNIKAKIIRYKDAESVPAPNN